MKNSFNEDFKNDGLVSQLVRRITDLERFEREFRLKKFGGSSAASIPFAWVEDQQPNGTNGGGSSADTYVARTLNTEVLDTDGICTLAANQVTLSAGTYDVFGSSNFYSTGLTTLRLRNITAGSDAANALPFNIPGGAAAAGAIAIINGRFTIAAAQALELQYICEVAQATNGLGISMGLYVSNYNEVEIFSRLLFWKVG